MKQIAIILGLGLVLRLWLSVQIYSGDVNNHVSWGQDMLAFGPRGIYQRDFQRYGTMTPTYPPLAIALFTLSQWTYDKSYAASWWLNEHIGLFPSSIIWWFQDQDTQPAFHKIWAILADLGIAWLVYRLTNKLWVAGLVVFNPAFFYNSASWGQIDSLPVFWLMLSLYWLSRKKLVAGCLAMLVGLLTKQALIIFIPVWLLVMWWQHFSPRELAKAGLVTLAGWYLAFLPFWSTGNVLAFPWATYWNKIQTGSGSDFIVDHAFNFWTMLVGWGSKIPDSQLWILDLSYRTWGYGLFFLAAGLTLARLVISRQFWVAAGLINLSAFLFLTRMHERYLLPTLPLLLIWAHKKPWRLLTWLFLSIFYWLNLHHNWWYPRWPVVVDWLEKTTTINIWIGVLLVTFAIIYGNYLHLARNDQK